MKHPFLITIVAALALSPAVAPAATTLHTFNGLNLAIPDGNPSGLANVQTLGAGLTDITSVRVTLVISGTFNGDIYAYLQHDGGLAVLLNRSGRAPGNLFGYGDSGYGGVVFDDVAANDIHTYQNQGVPVSALMGTWQPDGRSADPDMVLDTSPRTPFPLGTAFGGKAAEGTWTLFVADLSGGNSHTLNGWSLELTGVPEPGSVGLLGLALAAFALRRRR